MAVYRCVAEGVTNALRHARATHIEVRVCDEGDHVLVDVVDDGAGGPVVAGVGLSSLAQRAESLGGCLERHPGRPTRDPPAPAAAGTPGGDRVIGVIVVDDHPVVLTGLAALIQSDPQLALAGTARSVTEARALDPDTEPAVAVLDLQLPDGDGITLGTDLKQRWPELRVLILTMNADEATVIRSLASGLDGYLLKDADPEDVLAALHSAASGALVVGRGASAAVVAAAASAPRSDALAASTRGTSRSSS